MFYIDSTIDKPDIEYLVERVKRCVKEGINVGQVKEVYVEALEIQKRVKVEIELKYNIENINSNEELSKYLKKNCSRDILSICYSEKTHKWTTKDSALRELSKMGYTWADDMIKYRRICKYVTTLGQIANETRGDGRLHPVVSVGKTNRINYAEPALMSIQKSIIWKVLKPKKKGNKIVSVDIKNQEPWILINMLKIEQILDVMRREDIDGLYEVLYKVVYGGECSKEEKKEFKRSWNALTYGGSLNTIRPICRNIDAEVLNNYFKKIKEFKKYKRECKEEADRDVQKLETYFGTVLYADDLGRRLMRQLMDMKIQGTGTDILALLVQHFDEEIGEWYKDVELYFTRHDELVLEVSEELYLKEGEHVIIERLREIFEHKVDSWEPFKVSIKFIETGELRLEDIIQQNEEDEVEEVE